MRLIITAALLLGSAATTAATAQVTQAAEPALSTQTLTFTATGASEAMIGLRGTLSNVSATLNGQPLTVYATQGAWVTLLSGPDAQAGNVTFSYEGQGLPVLTVQRGEFTEMLWGNLTLQRPTPESKERSEGLIRSPADNTHLSRGNVTKVTTVSEYREDVTLEVRHADGTVTPVGPRQVGLQRDDMSSGTSRREYLGVPLKPGVNTLVFSSGQSSERITITAADVASDVHSEIVSATADGHTPISVKVTVTDAAGRPAYVPSITINNADLLDPDQDPSQPGEQLLLKQSDVTVRIRPTTQAGPITFAVTVNGTSVPVTVNVTPAQRELLIGHLSGTYQDGTLSSEYQATAELPIGDAQLSVVASSEAQVSGVNATPEPGARYITLGDRSISNSTLRATGPVAAQLSHPAGTVRYGAPILTDPIGPSAAGDALQMKSGDLDPGAARLHLEASATPGGTGEQRAALTLTGLRFTTLPAELIGRPGLQLELQTADQKRTLTRGIDYAVDDAGNVTFAAPLSPDAVLTASAPGGTGVSGWVGARYEHTSGSGDHTGTFRTAAALGVSTNGQNLLRTEVNFNDATGPVQRAAGMDVLLNPEGFSAALNASASDVPGRIKGRETRTGQSIQVRVTAQDNAGPSGRFSDGLNLQASAATDAVTLSSGWTLRPHVNVIAQGPLSSGPDWGAKLTTGLGLRSGTEQQGQTYGASITTGTGSLKTYQLTLNAAKRDGPWDTSAQASINERGPQVTFGVKRALGSVPALGFDDATATGEFTVQRNGEQWNASGKFGLNGNLLGAQVRAYYERSGAQLLSQELGTLGVSVSASTPLNVPSGQLTMDYGAYAQASANGAFGGQLGFRYANTGISGLLGTEINAGTTTTLNLRSGASVRLSEESTLSAEGLSTYNGQWGHRYGLNYTAREQAAVSAAYLRYRSGTLAGERGDELSAEIAHTPFGPTGQMQLSAFAQAQPGDLQGTQLGLRSQGLGWITSWLGAGFSGELTTQPWLGRATGTLGAELSVQPIQGTLLTAGVTALRADLAQGHWTTQLSWRPYLRFNLMPAHSPAKHQPVSATPTTNETDQPAPFPEDLPE